MPDDRDNRRVFEQTVLPHLSSAFNLARWLMGNDDDANDIVQESFIRALKYFRTFRGGDARAWLLTIVRNTSYSRLNERRAEQASTLPFDDRVVGDETNPEVLLTREIDRSLVRQALEELPAEFREVIVLRELEGYAYKEIAALADIPIGTVMSRLARARRMLALKLQARD